MASSGCCDDTNMNVSEKSTGNDKSANGAPPKESLFSRIRNMGRLQIEAIEREPRKIFYLPESSSCSQFKFDPTQTSCCEPYAPDTVKHGDAFEIKVVGFQVAKHDRGFTARSGNEIIVSSTQPMSTSTEGDVMKIHFNYERNRTRNSHKPNTYITVPHSKRYLFSDAGHKRDGERTTRKTKIKAVDVSLKIVEVDKLAKPIVYAFTEAKEFQNAATQFKGVPVLATISPILGFASMLGQKALSSYSTNDLVLSEPFSMRLAKKETERIETGPYLRYGYYFILSEEQKFKLYACDCTSDNMKLHVKETKRGRFLPLNNVDYIVLQVSQPSGEFPIEKNFVEAADVESKMKSIMRLVKEKRKAKGSNEPGQEEEESYLDPHKNYLLKRLESYESLVGTNSDSE